MAEQKEILNDANEKWMSYNKPPTQKPYEQTDDISLIGIKLMSLK